MGNRKKTQTDRVIEYIEKFGSISTIDAFVDLGITRLSARIWEIRHDRGYEIKSEMCKGQNRFGEPVHYYRYSIVED